MTDIQILYEGPIVKRSEAKAQGLKRYFTGKPCQNGHVDERNVNGWWCVSCARDTMIRFRQSNPEYFKEYRKNSDYKGKYNPEYRAAYQKEHKERYAMHQRVRRSRIRSSGGKFSKEDIEKILKDQNNSCAYCYADFQGVDYHIDHIFPVSLGGSSWPINLQCLCAECNIRKSNKHPDDWHKEIGRFDLIGKY